MQLATVARLKHSKIEQLRGIWVASIVKHDKKTYLYQLQTIFINTLANTLWLSGLC